MSDRNERPCKSCGSYLHHESDCGQSRSVEDEYRQKCRAAFCFPPLVQNVDELRKLAEKYHRAVDQDGQPGDHYERAAIQLSLIVKQYEALVGHMMEASGNCMLNLVEDRDAWQRECEMLRQANEAAVKQEQTSRLENNRLRGDIKDVSTERDELKFSPGATKVGVMAVIVNNKRQVWLGKKGRAVSAEFVGKWVAPGGRVKYAETLHDALLRECREEVGVDVRIVRQLGVQQIVGEKFHFVFPTFVCEVDSGTPVAGDDLSEGRWFDEAELADLPMTPITAAAVKEMRNSIKL